MECLFQCQKKIKTFIMWMKLVCLVLLCVAVSVLSEEEGKLGISEKDAHVMSLLMKRLVSNHHNLQDQLNLANALTRVKRQQSEVCALSKERCQKPEKPNKNKSVRGNKNKKDTDNKKEDTKDKKYPKCCDPKNYICQCNWFEDNLCFCHQKVIW